MSVPGLATDSYPHRVRETTVQLVDANGQPLQDVPVRLFSVGDDLPTELGEERDVIRDRRTDRKGLIRFPPAKTTHTRLQLPAEYPVPLLGSLIPDSCGYVVVRVPVKGSVSIDLQLHTPHASAPLELQAAHVDELQLRGHESPMSILRRVRFVRTGGIVVARYTGMFRTDVSPAVELLLPGKRSVIPLTLKSGRTLSADSRDLQEPTKPDSGDLK